jgi:Ca2+-binding RTX toxin-like protein
MARFEISSLAPLCRVGRIGAGLLIAGALHLAGGVDAADADVTCSFSAGGALTIQSGQAIDSATIVRSGNDIVVKDNHTPVSCGGGQPTVLNTHVIAHADNSGGESYFTIDLRGGPFTPGQVNEPGNSDEIDIQAFMGAGPDRLYIWGSPGDDSWRLGRTANGVGVNLNAAQEAAPGETPNVDVDLRDAEMAVLLSGSGNDRIVANGGPELSGPLPFRADINADEGDDLVFAGSASGFITAGPGRDEVHGGEGSDWMSEYGPTGDDDVYDGGPGRDEISWGEFDASVRADLRLSGRQDTGAAGRDQLSSIEDATVFETYADAVLIGTDGDNELRTGDGNDLIAGLGGADRMQGADGNDTVSYATPPAGVGRGVSVDLTKVDLPQDTGGAGIDRLEEIANVIGSPFPDRLTGTQADNRFEIRDGNGDAVTCSAGADTVVADVEGTDPVGADCESVQFDFRPDTRIDAGPPSLSRNAAPSFRFASTKPGSTFECSLDGGPFGACDAAPVLSVADGAHVLRVRARDLFGALDLSPAEHAFSVDTLAPRVTRTRLLKGKRLAYRLSEAATVKIAVKRGSRSRTLTREAVGGANGVGLARIIRPLKASGRPYRVTLVASDRAGNRSRPVRISVK